MKFQYPIILLVLMVRAAALPAADVCKSQESLWPAPVKDFVAPAAGEHPRLFFRKSDLPEIRRRAQTPQGQAIVKRLRVLLNGSDGESMLVLAGLVSGKVKGTAQVVKAGTNTFTVMTLQKGQAPEDKAVGETLVVGGQTVEYDGRRVSFVNRAGKPRGKVNR